ncbi:T9SS type B sorting domain-containing protein [Winogradskyella poriferorum]|uniref:T9SS type B sorting domain-containing protein n=1 Tax=Winogradskyella poriferorum TaxID=307627 RepID=A0ABU7W643_9FLAO
MNKIACLLVLMVLVNFSISAQAEASKWYFGINAGLDFSTGNPIALTNGELVTDEGCATISENNGDLLFYTDGITVWDKQHNIMPNGTGLTGDSSSTQSAIIVPKPGDVSIFYIFTVDDLAGPNGLRYSEVNMTLNGGNGDITNQKNIELNAFTTEKISAVKHANGIDFWVVTHDWNNNNFLSYQVTTAGVNIVPVISSVGEEHGDNGLDSKGYLKISPDASRLALASWSGNSVVEIFDFDNTTGIVSNPILIGNGFFSTGPASGAYGIEFSPDSNLLYVTDQNFLFGFTTSRLFQFDLTLSTANDMINSVTTLYDDSGTNTILGALQLAVDGKIYIARAQEQFLDVIENPDEIGFASNYSQNAVSLGNRFCGAGLPPFISSFFNFSIITQGTCLGQGTEFSLNSNTEINSIIWDFGDGFTSTETNPTHYYQNAGSYTISAEINAPGETFYITNIVTINNFPVANTPEDMYRCDDIENGGYQFFDLSTKDSEIYNLPGVNITYHLSEENAIDNIDPLETNYENISNTQTIYVRVQNSLSPDCFDLTSFQLHVLETPISSEDIVYLCTNESVVLSAGEGFDYYNWSNGETTESITVNTTGNYAVEVINSLQTSQGEITCAANRLFTVVESDEALITNVEVTDWTENDNTISVFVDGIGDYEYSLDNVTYQDESVFSNLLPGEYVVYVRDKNNCGIVTQEVYLLYYPRFFSPNGDGVNEYWQIEFSDSEPDNEILIYDRYGKLLAQIPPNSLGWDGTYDGAKMPAADYWFKIKRPGKNKVYTGHFSLKR